MQYFHDTAKFLTCLIVQDANHSLLPFTDGSSMQDGWILGPNSELLFWVPPILRDGLFWPRNKLVLGAIITTKLDFTCFVHGEQWINCKGA